MVRQLNDCVANFLFLFALRFRRDGLFFVTRDDGLAIFGCVLKFIFVVEHGLEKIYGVDIFFFDGFGKSFVNKS